MTISFNADQPTRPADPSPVDEWPSPEAPLEVAHGLADEVRADGVATRQRWRGSWWERSGAHWVEIEEPAMRGWVYDRMRNAFYLRPARGDGEPKLVPWNPDRTKVANVLDAYGSAAARIDERVEPGSWITTGEHVPGVIATPSGLFDVDTRALKPATADWFTTWSLPYDYDPDAGEPVAWLAFLRAVWPDDPDQIAMLQEWLGYLVSGRTDQQKAMLLVGPRRSGKGTILRVATALVGAANTAAPTLASLTTQFGLMPCIGKALLAVGDARLSGGTSTLVERILSITGEDSLTVDRKYRDPWTGRLPGRIMIASNEVPDFRDASGAIGSRFLIAKMVTSFYGREDPDLEGKLMSELPAIMKWALGGLDRLRQRGRFTEGSTAVEAREDMEESESPVAQFVEECCVLGPYTVNREVLYAAWNAWRGANGYSESNIRTFGKQLRAAHADVGDQRLGSDGARERLWTGVGLRASFISTHSADIYPHGPKATQRQVPDA